MPDSQWPIEMTPNESSKVHYKNETSDFSGPRLTNN